MDEDDTITTLPPPLQLGVTVTASLYITAAHSRQSTNSANDLTTFARARVCNHDSHS